MRASIALLALALIAGTADARNRRSFGGEKYVSNGEFGLGLELGSPSGLNGKYFLSEDRALDFGVGFIDDSYYFDHRSGVHLYLDYMFHPFLLTKNPTFELPFFIGIGGRIWDFHDHLRGDPGGDAIGVRVPVGILFDFNKVPMDIFVQLTFVADVFVNYYKDDRLGPHLEGSFGVRYWFN